ncbi:MAG: class IV adenylate cyclase [Hoeflea sp.]|uniref:class IV adenylate cyclase n=1 Tax=Hoeflea sp. TaxID=1940281 RepID=UPI0032F02735
MLCDPGDHFKGRYEVERKYRVETLEQIRADLASKGAVAFALGNQETDIFLDMPDRRLAGAGQQQVLRIMRPSGRVLWICKGPGADRCVAMDLDDPDKALEMLAALGFGEAGRLTKARDIYFLGDFHVTLDNLEGLGSFVEVAVMTDDAEKLANWTERVEAFALELGLETTSLENRSYRAIMASAQGR